MSKSEKYNLNIDAGTTFVLTVTVENTDLTGYSARTQFRTNVTSSNFVYEGTTGNGDIVITDAVNGVFTLTISATDTAALSKTYVYDIEIESAGGVVTRVLRGDVVVRPQVTR